jgi:hypothetical protein
MAVRAMGWGAIDDAAFADSIGHIIPMGADEQVRGTDAGTDIAMVANALTVWDSAARDCPSVAMSTDFTAATFDATVVSVEMSYPYPT